MTHIMPGRVLGIERYQDTEIQVRYRRRKLKKVEGEVGEVWNTQRKHLGEGDTSVGSLKGEEVLVYDYMCLKFRIFTTSH